MIDWTEVGCWFCLFSVTILPLCSNLYCCEIGGWEIAVKRCVNHNTKSADMLPNSPSGSVRVVETGTAIVCRDSS